MLDPTELKGQLEKSHAASFEMGRLGSELKNQALLTFAELIQSNSALLFEANKKDLENAQQTISAASLSRLKFDQSKLDAVVSGIKDLVELPDPVGKISNQTMLDTELTLERCSVPFGVIAVVFESRPDVIPQVLSLLLKSSNVGVLKGGSEAKYTQLCFKNILEKLSIACPFLPESWALILDSREEFRSILAYDTLIDLVIPRGSAELVRSIQQSTRIPVLGHADGVCHLYVHASAHINQAVEIALDAKTQYPAACNSIETLLIDAKIASAFLNVFVPRALSAKIKLLGSARVASIDVRIETPAQSPFGVEFSDLQLAVEIVDGEENAIQFINRFGSHHTDVICATDEKAIEAFLQSVDSACTFANASSRFADGFRFGFGAEVGISTSKVHARGPVGLEGIVTYKYKLRGSGQVVKDYVGDRARPFMHKRIK